MPDSAEGAASASTGASPAFGLHWPIKRSFIRYVARMTDGQILGGHGLTMPDASMFVFPVDEAELAGAVDLLMFRGELRLQAHNGALAVRIANPRIDVSGERAVLTVDNPEGSGAPLRMVALAASSTLDEDVTTWAGTDVRLTVEAVALFGGYYGEDEPFDDLTIVVPSR